MNRSVNLYSIKNEYVAAVQVDTGDADFVDAVQWSGATYKVETPDRYREINVFVIATADTDKAVLLRAPPPPVVTPPTPIVETPTTPATSAPGG